MNEQSEMISQRSDSHRNLASIHLKSCPVCNAINARANRECFVCSWSGKFNDDPVIVKIGLDDLIDRCPELAEELVKNVPTSPKRQSGLTRLLTAIFRKPLDLFA